MAYNGPSNDYDGKEPRYTNQWSLRNVRWRTVLGRQDYANLMCTILLVVALAVVHWVATPRHPLYYVYDGTISYPYKGNPTIPGWVPVIIPLIMLIATVAVGELVYSRYQHHNLTDCLATMLHFILDGVQAFVFVITMTVITKYVCGRLRPDFLSRCNPSMANGDTAIIAFGQNTDTLYPCQTDSDDKDLKDGYQSFPSGHASTGFSLTVYASAYLIWCFNMRKPWNPEMRNWTFKRKFFSDLGSIVAKYWMLSMLMFAWGVSLSRVIDYQHNYSDIVGGAFLGTLGALVYVLRAIPRYRRVLSPEAVDDAAAVAAGNSARMSTGGAYNQSSEDVERAILGSGHSSVTRTATGNLRHVEVSPTHAEA